jgi:hypothetical protein
MSNEDWLIRLTAFISFTAYIGALTKWGGKPRSGFFSFSNMWMLGCIAFVIHFISAFHYKYEWSHAKAIEFTARQTFQITGVKTGIGLYFNYFFTLTWLSDLLWLKLANQSYKNRPRWLCHPIHGFIAFMWFNATVIFGSLIGQLIGGFAFLGVVSLWAYRQKIKGYSAR